MAWLSGWSYRKEITITGQSGAGTDFQVKLDIGDSAGGDFHLEGHCTNFPQDIEVTDNDETTPIDYWIEDITADPIKMWVEVADDLGSNQTIYIYYGKSGATTNSDISTIALGDVHYTAENNVLPTAYTPTWSLAGVAGSVSGGLLTINDNSSSTGAMYDLVDVDIAGNVIVTSCMRFNAGDPYAIIQIWTTAHSWYIDLSATAITNAYRGADTAAVDGDTEAVYDFVCVGATMSIYRNGVFVMDTENTHTSSNKIIIGPYGSTQTGIMEYKYIFLRKYNSPEPAFSSAGSEETPPTGASPTAVFYGPLVGPLGGPI